MNRWGCISCAIRFVHESPNLTPSPPPMTTPSMSSTFTTEAMPAPSARTARSIAALASLSPCSSARAQMPLVTRVRLCSSISLNRLVLRPFSCWRRTRASMDARPA